MAGNVTPAGEKVTPLKEAPVRPWRELVATVGVDGGLDLDGGEAGGDPGLLVHPGLAAGLAAVLAHALGGGSSGVSVGLGGQLGLGDAVHAHCVWKRERKFMTSYTQIIETLVNVG